MSDVIVMKSFFSFLSMLAVITMALVACEKKSTETTTGFSKADSVTDSYLALQDSMLASWNAMISDDNRKIRAMRHLLHELSQGSPEDASDINGFEERVDGLAAMRYNQRTVADSEIVSEYDFASNSLVTELISLTESQPDFARNKTLQRLVDNIRSADQRVNNYRDSYDQIASRFNAFLEKNLDLLQEINRDSFLQKKPLFQMAGGD
jgi:hypothetical protein